MQILKTLNKRIVAAVSLILVFALVIGFTAKTLISRNLKTNMEFKMIAEPVPEGILLTFSNIPSDATHLWIFVSSSSGTGGTDYNDFISSHTVITDTSVQGISRSTQQLKKVKDSGQIIFPIVNEGTKYNITANVYNQQEWELYLNDQTAGSNNFLSAETECIGKSGIYFDKDSIKLSLNDTNSAVTISSEPVFSSGLTFDSQKYSFHAIIMVQKYGSIGVGEHQIPNGLSRDGLTWTFEPQMTQDIKEHNATRNLLENGTDYSAWVSAMVNIIYNDIKWSVEIAKSPEFNYSL